MKTALKNIIFHLFPGRAMVYYHGLSSPVIVNIPSDIMNNLEILNPEKLNILIKSSLPNESVNTASVIILLDQGITFEENLTQIPESLQPSAVEKFLDLVPLKNIISRKYTVNKKTTFITADNELLNAFIEAFRKLSSDVTAVIPVSVVYYLFPKLNNNINYQMMLGKISKVRYLSITTPIAGQKSGRASFFKHIFGKKKNN